MRSVVLVALCVVAVPAGAMAQTPSPGVLPGSPCPAVVEVSWDVTSIEGATRVRWRLHDEGGERLDAGYWNGTSGSETIDLRSYGPVLNGTGYTVQVRARAGSEWAAGWSDRIPFSNTTSVGSVDAERASGTVYGVHLSWNVPSPIAACAAVIGYEVADAPFSVPDDNEPASLVTGVLPSPSDTTSIDLSYHGPGTRWIRLYATVPGPDGPAGHDVGLRGAPATVSLTTGALSVIPRHRAVCGGLSEVGADQDGVTVTISGPIEASGESPPTSGAVQFTGIPTGSYTVVASTQAGCASEPATVSVSSNQLTTEQVEIPECPPLEPAASDVDLAVEIVPPPTDPLTAGTTYTWQVVVRNADDRGPAPERDVRLERVPRPRSVSPRLQRGRRPVTRTHPTVVGRETVPVELCPGESETYAFQDVAPGPGEWSYTAILSGSDRVRANDRSGEAVTAVGFPDLNPSVTQSHTELPPGGTMTYTVEVKNEGAATADDVVVESEISENLDILSASGTAGFSCDRSGRIVRCAGATLTPGWTASIEIRAQLPLVATAGHSLVFGTQVDPDDAIEETDENDNTAGAFAQTGETTFVEHTIPIAQAVAVAEEHGFIFEAAEIGSPGGRGGGQCLLWFGADLLGFDPHVFFLAKHQGVQQFVCEFRLFMGFAGARRGGRLAPGWTFEDIDLDLSRTRIFEQDVNGPSGDDPSVIVRTRTSPAVRCRVDCTDRESIVGTVRSITLRGPQGVNWPAAFPDLN